MKYLIPLIALTAILVTARLAQAVQFGWQPLPDGGIEYQIQVEPELLDSFRKDGFTSDLPENLQRNLRRIRITVGNAKLPNEGDVNGPKQMASVKVPSPSTTEPTTSDVGKNNFAQQPAANNSAPPLLSANQPPSTPADASTPSGTLDLPPPPTTDEQPAKAAESPIASTPPAATFPTEPPPAAAPAVETPRPLSSLPFFQSGQISKINDNAASKSATSMPRLNENDCPPTDSRTFASDMAIAAKPAVLETPVGGNPSSSFPAPPKPWLPLMGALLALFASLGANVYLAWIHQGVRMKYRTLLLQK